jgi:hypothetical protein
MKRVAGGGEWVIPLLLALRLGLVDEASRRKRAMSLLSDVASCWSQITAVHATQMLIVCQKSSSIE